MFLLDPKPIKKEWLAAGIFLELIPLPEDVDSRFVEETTERVYDDNGKLKDVKRDNDAYARKVGRYCIKGWGGVIAKDANDDIQELNCTPENIDKFMMVDVAQQFVFSQVKGLTLHIFKEEEKANTPNGAGDMVSPAP